MCCHPAGGRNDTFEISGCHRQEVPDRDQTIPEEVILILQFCLGNLDAWTHTMDPCPKRTSRLRVS